MDENQYVAPYEGRQFPLSDDEYKKILIQDSLMAPPQAGPSHDVSGTTSRTTSRSSSMMEVRFVQFFIAMTIKDGDDQIVIYFTHIYSLYFVAGGFR